MPSLNQLIDMFPDNEIMLKHKKQTYESWTKGKYYLCGHIPLDVDEDITNKHLEIICEKNKNAYACNSWEMGSIYKSRSEYDIIMDLMKIRMRRLNGIFRVIVFWISTARKRANEKVFHTESKYIKKMFTDDELELHKTIGKKC